MGPVHLLGNRSTAAGRDRLDRARAALESLGAACEVLAADSLDQSSAVARDAVDAGAERLIAVGGDGVVNIAVNAVAETPTVLGVVPDGTGNDFARALGLLEGDLRDQLRRALAPPAPVDAVRTDHGWVASVATLGFSGDVTARANALDRPRGQQRYTVATLLQLPRLRTLSVQVDVDGKRLADETTLLAVGNTEYFGGGMRICPGADPADGRLAVVSIGHVSRWRFLRVFPTVFRGGHIDRDEVSTAVGRVVDLHADGVDLWADGELLGPLPVRLEAVPGALRVAGLG